MIDKQNWLNILHKLWYRHWPQWAGKLDEFGDEKIECLFCIGDWELIKSPKQPKGGRKNG